jgi:hypothetical protein
MMALGTERLLGLPIDAEGVEVVAQVLSRLAAGGTQGRPHHSNVMLAGAMHEQLCDHIATVNEVAPR